MTSPAKIVWSCVARNDTILAEATAAATNKSTAGSNHNFENEHAMALITPPSSFVAQAARELLARPATPGFEFHTTRFWSVSASAAATAAVSALSRKSNDSSNDKTTAAPTQSIPNVLKGIKFHLYDHVNPNDDFDAGFLSGTSTSPINDNNTITSNHQSASSGTTPQLCIWVFAAVYDPSVVSDRTLVQAYLEKMVHLTENFRLYDPHWYTSDTLGLQGSFAPILQQQMSQVDSIAKLSRLEQSVDACRDQMERNIALLLERGERIEDLDANASRLQEMAVVFQKKARDVKRYQMRKHAKHGFLLGAAVTAATAVVVVPPLVALL